MKIISNIRAALVAVFCWTALCSGAAVINGVVVDQADTTALIGASVKLLRANTDSTFVKGEVTDANGVFNIKGVKQGKYLLQIDYIGYTGRLSHVTVGKDGRDVNMGVLTLDQSGVSLAGIEVVGVKSAITVKEDTIEFNADSYKLQTNAVVEDLLKRLPGVEIGSDGKITANGKEVKKILIDGKEFFADDPTVASKNIPADMIDKLQVVDRKSDLARLTGGDDGEDETVINLTVKKGMNNGWFGTVTGGYGTGNHYAGTLMANYFHDGNQFTLLGGGNNTNNLGVGDGGQGRFQRFGGDRGVTKSQYVGINFNVGSKDEDRLRVGGDVMYSHTDRDTQTTRNRQYLFTDSVSYYDAQTLARDKGHNLRGDFRLKWEMDTLNTLEFRPNFSLNFSNSTKDELSLTRAGDASRTEVNRSSSDYDNDGKSYEFGGQVVYNRKAASRPGRSFSAQLRYTFSRVNEDGNTYTNNVYYLKDDEDQTIDQVYANHRTTNGVNGRLTWTEPLGNVRNARFLEFAYMGNYRYNKATKSVYDITRGEAAAPLNLSTPQPLNLSALSPLRSPVLRRMLAEEYGTDVLRDPLLLAEVVEDALGPELSRAFNERLSNDFRNTYYNQSFQLGFRQVRRAYNLNVGLTVNSAMSKSRDLINNARDIPSRWVWSVAPYARFRYKFSKTRNLNINYRSRSTQPTIAQLQPVADESNPLNIVVGNPSLKPTFSHRLNIRFSDFDQRAQRNIMAMLNVNMEQNSIISTTDYDSTTGGRRTTYANVGGVWNAMAMNLLSLPFGSRKTWYFTSHAFLRYARAKGYNNGNINTSNTFSINYSPGLAFRNGEFDIELRPRYNFQTTNNSLGNISDRNVHTYGGQFNATYNAPFGLVVATDLTYSNTSGYSDGYNASQWLWNGSVSYQMLRDKSLSLTLSIYDILGQRKTINRNVTANYIEDVAYNSLTRYGMLTVTYRFSSFKKGEEPKLKGDDDWGPRGGGRPGGGPGGGRPGGWGGGRPGGW